MDCPYPHEKKVEVAEAGSVFLCDSGQEACFRPIMLCPKCSASNRTLARFCRSCGEDIAYAQKETELASAISVSQATQFRPRIRNFRELDVEGFSLLYVHKGFLVVGTTDGRIFVTDSLNLRVPIEEFRLRDTPLTINPSSLDDDDGVVISTKQAAYKLSFLPDAMCTEIADFSDIGETKGPLYLTSEGLVGLVVSGGNTKVIVGGGQRKSFDVGEDTSPGVLAEGTLYFVSGSKLYRFELNAMKLTGVELPEDRWNLKQVPLYDPQAAQIYLCSDNNIYHLPVDDANGSPMRIPNNSFTGFNIALRDQKLFVAHSQGLTVLNSYRGRRLWDLQKDLFIELTATRAPKLIGNYVLIVSLNDSGRQEINLIGLADILAEKKNVSADIITLAEFDHVAVEPVLGPGSLIIADSSEPKLMLYRLPAS